MLPFKLVGTFFTGRISLKGFAKGDKLECILRNYFYQKKIRDISEIDYPIAIPSVDINTGDIIYATNQSFSNIGKTTFADRNVIYEKGDLASIVRASTSYPGVFEPKQYYNRILVDGGVRVNTPVTVLKEMGADVVIAVCFDTNYQCHQSLNILSVASKSFDIMGQQINQDELNKADYIIRPSTPNISLLDGSKSKYIATQGYQAVKNNIQEIKKILY